MGRVQILVVYVSNIFSIHKTDLESGSALLGFCQKFRRGLFFCLTLFMRERREKMDIQKSVCVTGFCPSTMSVLGMEGRSQVIRHVGSAFYQLSHLLVPAVFFEGQKF